MSQIDVAATAGRSKALEAATLCEAFQLTAEQHADAVALRTPGDGVTLTWREYAARVERVAGGLAALGVGPGDTVALMLVNRPEFHVLDTAALHLGATPFSIYNTSSPEQIAYLFANAGNRVVVTERRFADVVRAVEAPELEHLILLEDGLPDADHPDFASAWRSVGPEDVATLIYTSGTTGPPKGVQLTHRNLMAALNAWDPVIPVGRSRRIVSYLPCAHLADRFLAHYTAIGSGASITSVEEASQVVAALPDVRPTGWLAVPRIWEKLKAALEAQGITDPAALGEDGRRAVRERLGLDGADWVGSGAAPIPVEVLEYFIALGLPVVEGWAMSETSCAGSVNPIDDVRPGTVGRALPGIEARVADGHGGPLARGRGELLVRGAVVMLGYRGDPEKTAEAVDADGWLHTGDVAEIDADGYIRIVDRKKELIINAAGKNMSPANIEQALKASSPLIGQACAIGDRRPYNVALLVLDPDAAAAHAAAHDLPDRSPAALAVDPTVLAAVAAGVDAANARLSRVEQIKRFTILPVDWLPDGDELTPTMKLKRRGVAAKYAAEIEALYA